MIPDSVLAEIQDKLNIADFINTFVPLKRAGRSFKGLCPFHQEKTPSFVVSPDKQIFHCFGCGASGTIISFHMKHQSLEFRDAVRELADRAGVTIPEDVGRREQASSKNEVFEVIKAAEDFYIRALENAGESSVVRAYVKKRGLTRDALSKFGIGYSPDAWDQLIAHLGNKAGLPLLERAGLVLPKQGGGHYDRFRNRLMFPIRDVRGNHLGFGARALDDSIPKYLNSPETEIYQKGKHLYGFHLAADAVKKLDEVVIVEGYMDLIACVMAGTDNVVASSGTALTVDQIRLVKRYTRNVTALFDADKAGEMATLRGLDLLVQEDCSVRIAEMPLGNDPDTYIRSEGAEAFREKVLAGAKTFFDYKIALLGRRYPVKTVEGRVRIAMEMIETLRKVPNAVLKAGLVRRLSEELKLSENALQTEMEKKGDGISGMLKNAATAARETPARPGTGEPMSERILIGLLLNFPEYVIRARPLVASADFKNAKSRSIIEFILAGADEDEGVKPAQILNRIGDDAEGSSLVTRALHEAATIEDPDKAFEDCVRWIERCRKESRKDILAQEIRAAEMGGDLEKRNRLLVEFQELSKVIRK